MDREGKKIATTRLIESYYDGTISTSEMEELRRLVSDNSNQSEEMKILRQIFLAEDEMFGNIEKMKPDDLEDKIMKEIRRKSSGKLFGQKFGILIRVAAVSAVVLTGAGLFGYLARNGEQPVEKTGIASVVTKKDSRNHTVIATQASVERERPAMVASPSSEKTVSEVKLTADKKSGSAKSNMITSEIASDNETGDNLYSEEEIMENRRELSECFAMITDMFEDAYTDTEDAVDDVSNQQVIMKL